MGNLFLYLELLTFLFFLDWAAAEEHHADGNRHWHAFVRFKKLLRGRNPRLFDIDRVHPNIQSSQGSKLDLHRIWLYLNKEGRPIIGPWGGPSAIGCVTMYHFRYPY